MILEIFSETEDSKNIKLYECDNMEIIKNNDGYTFVLHSDKSDEPSLSIIINGDNKRIMYIINDYGKMIEKFYWK